MDNSKSAFPRPNSTALWTIDNGYLVPDQEGMTYRQWLVGQILPAIMRVPQSFHDVPNEEVRRAFVEEAHALADTVIAYQAEGK